MNRSESIGAIAPALAAAQGDFPTIPRTQTGQIGPRQYKYADLADIIKACQPILAKHGLAVVQTFDGERLVSRWKQTEGEEAGTVTEEKGRYAEGTLIMRTTLVHKSGEWIETVIPFPWANGKPQDLGSIMTYLRRYSLSAILGVSSEEDDDGAAAQDAAKRPSRGKQAAKRPGPKTDDGKGKGDGSDTPAAPGSAAQGRERATQGQLNMLKARSKARAEELVPDLADDESWHLAGSIRKQAVAFLKLAYDDAGAPIVEKAHVDPLKAAIEAAIIRESDNTVVIPDDVEF